ncbi:hypothetical protein A2U01_0061397, partial [Trifolium medium]|nr:hypothetical protein [Trifolium medium]
ETMSLSVDKTVVPEVKVLPEVETSPEAQTSPETVTSLKAQIYSEAEVYERIEVLCTESKNTQKTRSSEIKILKRPESETKSKVQVVPEMKTMRKQEPKTKSKIMNSSRVNGSGTKTQNHP